MKYCEEFAPLLSAFADGEVSEKEREIVLAHLDTCEGCRNYLGELMAMRAAFGELEEVEVPRDFAQGVMERLKKEEGRVVDFAAAKKVAKRNPLRRLMPLAACAAIAIMAVTMFPRFQSAKGESAPAAGGSAAVEYATGASAGASGGMMRDMDLFNGKVSVTEDAAAAQEESSASMTAEAAVEKPAPEKGMGAVDAAEQRKIFAQETELPLLCLKGAAAEEYLLEKQVKQGEGCFVLEAKDLKQLPEGLSLSAEDAAVAADLEDGDLVLVWAEEAA